MNSKRNQKNYFPTYRKKANAVLDGLTILIVIFIFALISVFASKVLDETNTNIQTDLQYNESKAIANNLNNQYIELFDNLILFVFVLLLLFVMISVFMLDTHPIFFIITIILLVSFFLVSIILANSWDDMMNDADITTYSNQFTYSSWLFSHLVELMIIVGFIISIILFIKFKG